MPSPVRQRLELGCRTLAVLALAMLAWRTWRTSAGAQRPLVTEATSELRPALARATHAPIAQLDLTIDSMPGAEDRDWAAAVAGAGTRVRWRTPASAGGRSPAGNTAPLAAAIDPLPDPSGRVRLVVVGAPEVPLTIEDRAGRVDSSPLASSGLRVLDARLDGHVFAQGARSVAITARRDSVVVRPVLVIANAGWEGKFIVAALEEAGWRVDARFAVAPQAKVQQGRGVAIDTANYAAVIAVDESARGDAAAIVRFVRDGGGAILAGDALSLPAFGAIRPARPGERVSPTLGAVAGDDPRRGLDGVALTASRNDALVLDRTGGSPRVVAARVGTARVLALGYSDSWRWRMEGGADAPRLHREWWSAMVASVVRAPAVPLHDVPAVDEAPYASLVAALGAPIEAVSGWGAAGGGSRTDWWEPLFFTLFVGALLVEWGSRRLRGGR